MTNLYISSLVEGRVAYIYIWALSIWFMVHLSCYVCRGMGRVDVGPEKSIPFFGSRHPI